MLESIRKRVFRVRSFSYVNIIIFWLMSLIARRHFPSSEFLLIAEFPLGFEATQEIQRWDKNSFVISQRSSVG